MKTTATKTTDNKTTFAELLRQYEQQASNRTTATEKDYTKAITDLATAVSFSVLKKCIETSQNPTLIQVKRDITKDKNLLAGLEYTQKNAFETFYNKDGEKMTKIADKDIYTAYNKLCKAAFGDGMDLINTAIIAIMTETEKAKERNGGTLPEMFFENKYSIRRLNRKVWIKTADSVNGWETVETTPIQETYKAVRRAVEQSRALQTDAKNGYTYLSDIAKDEQSGTEEIIYRRLPKYADLGGAVCDFNGKETAYTADAETVTDIENVLEKLNLSKQQADILKLRLSGYGYKAIATYYGVCVENVKNQVKRIRQKALAIGFKPATA